jgi:hypothetical protein
MNIMSSVGCSTASSNLFLQKTECLSINIINEQIKPFVGTVKYLGVIFYEKMTWRIHKEGPQTMPWGCTCSFIPDKK